MDENTLDELLQRILCEAQVQRLLLMELYRAHPDPQSAHANVSDHIGHLSRALWSVGGTGQTGSQVPQRLRESLGSFFEMLAALDEE